MTDSTDPETWQALDERLALIEHRANTLAVQAPSASVPLADALEFPPVQPVWRAAEIQPPSVVRGY